ncbi:MAG: hypothetical protein Q9225_007786, partial [Loekoesia sp. 1 TL-2023]
MNHLPWPHNDQSPPIEVPYVCNDLAAFDGLDFLEYPFRRGWSTPEDEFQWINTSTDDIAKRAQNWLFFGLLQVFLGCLFEKDDYIKLSHRSNNWVLDTRLLPLRFSDLVRSVKDGSITSDRELLTREDLREKWNHTFLKAKLHLAVLDLHMEKDSITSDETLRSVAAPISTLLQSLQRIAGEAFWPDEDPPAMCVVQTDAAILSIRRMLELNRCKAQVGSLSRLYSPSLNHYVSGLPHRQLQSDHDGCSWDRCVGNNVDEGSYKTQHVQETCSCRFVGPNTSQLTHLIRNDRLPLIELRITCGKPELKIVSARPNTKYVTLSHVWAGGLGNFKENNLPTCQLLRLYELLINLDNFRPENPRLIAWQFQQADWYNWGIRIFSLAKKIVKIAGTLLRKFAVQIQRREDHLRGPASTRPVRFWMDTLCIPVNPQHSDLRLKAIGNMALTYAAAERCLVLDPELQRISMKDLQLIQLNAHVLCSTWLTRSWTFQEARLSRAWYAQFADGLYNLNCDENAALHHHLFDDWATYKDDTHKLAAEMISWYHNMPALRQMNIYANQFFRFLSESFVTVWNHLVSRSTSKMEDVHGILANTLDLSASEVLALPAEERMKAILRVQRKLPVAMMYNGAHKVSNQSCRWVPLYPEHTRLSDLYGLLQPSRSGFFLDKVEGDPVGFLVDPSIPRYEKICLFDSGGSGPLWITFDMELEGPPITYEAPGNTIKVCYVVGHLKKSSEWHQITSRFQGARFALQKREGKTLHLVYEYSFQYSHHQRRYFEQEETFETVHAIRTDADAKFLVDSDLSSWPTLNYHRDTGSEHSLHGLHFYAMFWFFCVAVVWTPFTYISAISTHPSDLLLPILVFIFRVAIGCYEIVQLRKTVNEHAYQAWVRTFDESGCLRKTEDSGEDDQHSEISTRVK